MRISIKIFLLLIVFFFVSSAWAGGLSTYWGEVIVDNLKIGKSHNITNINNLPLEVFNTADETIDLKIEVVKPSQNELKEGYEPVPDISWIELQQDTFTLKPQEKAITDVIISIPDNEQYLGKKYQVWLWSHTVGRMVGVGLKSRLLLSTDTAYTDFSTEEEFKE